MFKVIFKYLSFLSFLVLAACGGGASESSGGIEKKEGTLSISPVGDITVREGHAGSLTVYATFTGYETSITYDWTCSSSLDVEFSGFNSRTLSFTTPYVDGDKTLVCRAQVGVEDGFSYSGNLTTGWVGITILDASPNILAPADFSVASGSTVNLEAVNLNNNSSPDYSWQELGESQLTIENKLSRIATFNAPIVQNPTVYDFKVSALENVDELSEDTVTVTVLPPEAPTINLIYPSSIDEERTLVFDASGSSDDLGIKSFSWSQLSGPSVELSSSSADAVTFTSPTTSEELTLEFQLTVTDDTDLTSNKIFQISILPVNELPEITVSGLIAEVNEQTPFTFDASGSFDPDGEIVSYLWEKNAGINFSIENATSSVVTFISVPTTIDGISQLKLTVEDDLGATLVEYFNIRIIPVNTPPTIDVTAPMSASSYDDILVQINSSDIDGGIVDTKIELLSGTKSTMSTTNTSALISAPYTESDQQQTYKLKVIDNEGAEASKIFSIDIISSVLLTQIHFPVSGHLTGNLTSVAGRTTDSGVGSVVDVDVSINDNITSIQSDANGYWRVDDIDISNVSDLNVNVVAAHLGGESSSHKLTIPVLHGVKLGELITRDSTIFNVSESGIESFGYAGNANATTQYLNSDESNISLKGYKDFVNGYYDWVFIKDEGLVYVTNRWDAIELFNSIDDLRLKADIVDIDSLYHENLGWSDTIVGYIRESNTFYIHAVDHDVTTVLNDFNMLISNNSYEILDFTYNGSNRNQIYLLLNDGRIVKYDIDDNVVESMGRVTVSTGIDKIKISSSRVYAYGENSKDFYEINASGNKLYNLYKDYGLNAQGIHRVGRDGNSSPIFVLNSHSKMLMNKDGEVLFKVGGNLDNDLKSQNYIQFTNNNIYISSNSSLELLDINNKLTSKVVDHDEIDLPFYVNSQETEAYFYSNANKRVGNLDLSSKGLDWFGLNTESDNVYDINFLETALALELHDSLTGKSRIEQISLPIINNDVPVDIGVDLPKLNVTSDPLYHCMLDVGENKIKRYQVSNNIGEDVISLSDVAELPDLHDRFFCDFTTGSVYAQDLSLFDIIKIDIASKNYSVISINDSHIGENLALAESIYYINGKNLLLYHDRNVLVAIDELTGNKNLIQSN